MWANRDVYVEIWCEKEALAGVLYPISEGFDVPLMVVKEFPSKGFVHLYFVRGVNYDDPDVPIVLVETEKSVLHWSHSPNASA